MTAKEKLLERAPHWSEEQARAALRLVEGAPSDTMDEWGNLSVMHEAAFGAAMRRLPEQERSAGHDPEA